MKLIRDSATPIFFLFLKNKIVITNIIIITI